MKQVILLFFVFLLACGDDNGTSQNASENPINPDTPIRRGTPGENLMLDEIPGVTDDNAASLTLSGT